MADELASQVTVSDEVLLFLDWLVSEHGKQDLRYFLEKPWKWQEEWEEYLAQKGEGE